MRPLVVAAVFLALFSGCASGPAEPSPVDSPPVEKAEGPPAARTPVQGEVSLPAEGGWNAALLLDNSGTGVWTVKVLPVFAEYASPEVVGLDDYGRCFVLASYSGKWFPHSVLHDGWWLGGLDLADVDPRVPGAELYTGGLKGNLYQVVPHEDQVLEGRLIAKLEGREIHTIVAGDLDPTTDGRELLVFTRPGALFRVTPTGMHGGFDATLVAEIDGRVRDAVVLPAKEGEAPEIACVSRTGKLRLLRMGEGGPVFTEVYSAPMGMGRIALRPPREGEGTVLYTTLDDGRILRHERGPGGKWKTECIFLGPQGARGVAAGRFAAADVETVAVFGYSGKVQLLTRGEKGWSVETIFIDREKGHWLAKGELDGRNATDELVCSGFGGRIVMLFRPPGYGRSELAE